MQATQTEDLSQGIEAQYELEKPVQCPHCRKKVQQLHAVRLLRTKVNFTSNLPRRGFALVCPTCETVLAAGLGARIPI